LITADYANAQAGNNKRASRSTSKRPEASDVLNALFVRRACGPLLVEELPSGREHRLGIDLRQSLARRFKPTLYTPFDKKKKQKTKTSAFGEKRRPYYRA